MYADSPLQPRALLINGTVGVGKTSVAEAVGGLLTESGVPNAVIDLDWLRRSWPAAPGDRFNFGMMLQNLHSIASNYLVAGAVRMVLAGVVEDLDDRKQCGDAVGIGLSVCRLQVELPVVHQRLSRRHENEPEALHWHLKRSSELAGILDGAGVDDFTVDATTLPISEVAAAVIATVGWP
ncbi:ATP-binding protein [Streptomyces fildesensis]|uniref:ATP-binding protein n=1 Tax=Streptomyces fildesensis TaxID=375757 RepID=UPI0018DFD9A2|nr:ATP-binding protein [Streptomyces fildesensis]